MTVTVTVLGTQCTDGETAHTRVTAVGTLQRQGQACRLTYEEPATADTPAATTAIVILPHHVTIHRKSDTQSRLTLETDHTHRCPYHTPYGTLTLAVTAHTIKNELFTPAGRLFLTYSLDMGSGDAIQHTIEIFVKEVSS